MDGKIIIYSIKSGVKKTPRTLVERTRGQLIKTGLVYLNYSNRANGCMSVNTFWSSTAKIYCNTSELLYST